MSNKIKIRGSLYFHGITLYVEHKYAKSKFVSCTPGGPLFSFIYLDDDEILAAFTKIQEAFSSGDAELTRITIDSYSLRDQYLATYIRAYLGYLFDRTDEDLRELTVFMGDGFVAPSIDTPDFDTELIKCIVASIEQKKNDVKSLLDKVLGEQDVNSAEPRKELKTSFFMESKTNKLADFNLNCSLSIESIALDFPLESVDDMIRFELMHMLFIDVDFKKCKYCGRYFVPSGRSDSLYCDRVVEGDGRLCSQIGPLKTFELSHKDDPIHRLYIIAYRRMDSRQRAKVISKEEFKDFGVRAREQRKKCYDGEITLEQFEDWLDSFR